MVLGIPWDVDTEGLKEYMSKYGELEDCIVMKSWCGMEPCSDTIIWCVAFCRACCHGRKLCAIQERSTGRSRGFGYVTFASVDDAKEVLSGEHTLGSRMLEVKVATPKEEMRAPAKKATRIFVARIPQEVTEETFRSHFEKYGDITDLYMPKDQGSKMHRGIGFITFANAESVENLMSETHELGGSAVVVDRATPKARDDDVKPTSRMSGRMSQGGYGAYNAYISTATRYAALGAPTLYDRPGPIYGRGEPRRRISKKIFVGRLPPEANSEDLHQYFGRFGRIEDVYIPRDPKRTGHRGFGFVTFAEEGVADRVSRRCFDGMEGDLWWQCSLYLQVAIDSATPVDDTEPSDNFMMNSMESFGGYGGPVRSYGRMYGGLDYDDWGYGVPGGRPLRADYQEQIGRPSRVDYQEQLGRPSRIDYQEQLGRPSRVDYQEQIGRPSRADWRYRPY
ncbi:hypothetical protein TSUD_224860 [Trifolium subterraneum]|uniref:RRM domain-containing protein n=1 Tax=Trifolium subterraneum TaxID=3900 RepID=A0A2Z6MR16_TRISU|nr:hypothetical protein TSUD_224860 [Trifolium subterraneum]